MFNQDSKECVLFLNSVPSPHSKPREQWDVGYVLEKKGRFVEVVDVTGEKHVCYAHTVKVLKDVPDR